jgi:exonuclease VII large subunit
LSLFQISDTYCDPKSFAWEHEFKAFIEEASKDKYGLKVKLPGGIRFFKQKGTYTIIDYVDR